MLRIKPEPKLRTRKILYTRDDQRERFVAIAKHYGLKSVDLFEQVLVALEADLNGQKPCEEKS